MTVEVRLHDFCGDVCPFLELEKDPVARTFTGEWVGGALTCANYMLCECVWKRFEAQKGAGNNAGRN